MRSTDTVFEARWAEIDFIDHNVVLKHNGRDIKLSTDEFRFNALEDAIFAHMRIHNVEAWKKSMIMRGKRLSRLFRVLVPGATIIMLLLVTGALVDGYANDPAYNLRAMAVLALATVSSYWFGRRRLMQHKRPIEQSRAC